MKNKKMGYVLVIIGVLLVGVGAWMVFNSNIAINEKKYAKNEQVAEQKSTIEKIDTFATNESMSKLQRGVGKLVENVEKDTDNDLTESEEKGRVFEEYVVSHFNKKYFTLKEWRSDKYYKGHYAKSNCYPDLEYEFSLDGKVVSFAIECKWRSRFNNEWITWASDEQADFYRKFEKERKMPVFVMIGIGGTPSAPERVYAVPLRVLKLNRAKEDYIREYMRKDTKKKFFLDTENLLLR